MNPWTQFVGYFTGFIEFLADLFSFLGGHQWAAAIVVLTIIVRTLLLPVARKQIKSMKETQRLNPEVQRIRQKYARDRQRMAAEMQELYQREGVNPWASCLPMIAQAPFMIAIFYSIRDLSSHLGDGAMPFLGLIDLTQPTNSAPGGWLLLLSYAGIQFLTTKQLNVGGTEQQRRLQMLMPILFVFFFMSFPAALVLYWTTQAVYHFAQQWIMMRDFREEAHRQKEAPKKKGGVVPGSVRPPTEPVSGNGDTPTPKSGNGASPPKSEKVQSKPKPVPIEPNILAARRELEQRRRERRRQKRRGR